MSSTQTPKSYVKRLDIFSILGEGILVSADIESKSRNGLLHYTRLVLDPLTMKIIKASCDCEGYAFRGYCWHIETLKQLVDSDERVREKIMKAKEELMRIKEDTVS
ncbi:zinc-finger domain protein [Sulfolobus monocaudavirus SMV1]|uniref:zinc-finger domain protein n=1 Tax=Sulfolobus monocaudavirus SMV1 TaxID=1351702 RepID=UPI0003D7C53D|nr:zinc-finger domain protein [Sulfolobus monocaudavirus SMV1]CDF81344.1 Zinc finger,SWIM domain-containing protein [Sulfolobus monocaudavirus SMV1]